jgi:hypothetical protein
MALAAGGKVIGKIRHFIPSTEPARWAILLELAEERWYNTR